MSFDCSPGSRAFFAVLVALALALGVFAEPERLASASRTPSPARPFRPFRQFSVAGHAKPSAWARLAAANCSWRTFDQRLDHFGDATGSFKQRYCLYDGAWGFAADAGFNVERQQRAPILFYTGNESPLEVYVNNTGLMWEWAWSLRALVVFAEHRFEGGSLPCLDGLADCMAYCTSAQALADYALLIDSLKHELEAESSPVIAFGGSYGGMLAGWFRMLYPNVIAGSIAASAPVWGLASTLHADRLDWSYRNVARGASFRGGAPRRCLQNIRAFWPLAVECGKTDLGLRLLADAVRSCGPLRSTEELLDWAAAPWFALAEGNYPFESDYIVFAIGPGKMRLPAWPLRAACLPLGTDFGVHLSGSVETVRYRVSVGDLEATVDWDRLSGSGAHLSPQQLKQSRFLELVAAMRDAVGVWYNVSGEKVCYNISEPAPTSVDLLELPRAPADAHRSCPACPPCPADAGICPPCPVSRCSCRERRCTSMEPAPLAFAWDGVTCCEDMWLYNGFARGTGHDMFWPPTVPRNATVDDVAGPKGLVPGLCGNLSRSGFSGYPVSSDPWSGWLTAYYGAAENISRHRNIVWSNGLFDPWAGGGVYPPGGGIEGPRVQNISADGSQVALLIEDGAHHLDLFFSDPKDPPSIRDVRRLEEGHARRWCEEWYAQAQVQAQAQEQAQAELSAGASLVM